MIEVYRATASQARDAFVAVGAGGDCGLAPLAATVSCWWRLGS